MVADIKKKQIEKWIEEGEKTSEEIREEIGKWKALGVDPATVTLDQFQLDARLQAILEYLVEKGIVEDEEFVNTFLKPRILKNLIDFRERFVEPSIQEFKRQQLTEGALEVPGVLGPDGKVIKH